MVLLERFELSASPLPRECSTPELQQPGSRVTTENMERMRNRASSAIGFLPTQG